MKTSNLARAALLVRASVSAALGIGLCNAVPAIAAELDELDGLSEVQITGTRILQGADYISPNPVQTLEADQLERLGIVNISDSLTMVPANVSNFQARNQGSNSFFVGSTLPNLRGLNPYFGTRTLTLVDSRRFVPTNQGQSVDLNMVPALLVGRVEVVTGGASAAYGSDAVSGVVNVILDKTLQGVKVEADYGMSQRGDGSNHHFGMAGGTSLFEGRGHLIFGAEYQKANSIDDCSTARRWCGASNGLLLNGGFGAEPAGTPYAFDPVLNPFGAPPLNPAWPQRVRVSNLRVNQSNAFGVIYNGLAGASTAISADAAGTGTSAFAIGQYGDLSQYQTVIGGDGAPLTAAASLYPEIERKTAYGRFTFDLTDSTSAFAEVSLGDVDAMVLQGGPGYAITSRCIAADNAYLSGAFGSAVLAAAGNDDQAFGACAPTQTLVRKDWYTQVDRNVTTATRVYRAVGGLEGRFGESGWHWDGYYQFGRTTRTQVLANNNTAKRMDMALDAVIDNRAGSATLGQPVCRVTRDGVPSVPRFPGDPAPLIDPARVALAVGCVPLNPFGNAAISPAASAYSFADLFEKNVIKQNVLAFNTSGELWKGWGAGPLSGAAGVEWRQEKLTNEAADLPFFQRTDFASQYGDPFAGTTQVREAYVEFEMPLLADKPFAKDLRLNVAGRRTGYETEDDLVLANPDSKVSVTTWKVGAAWDPLNWLRLRGSRSRDLRAAGFRELYYSQSIAADPPGTFFGSGGVYNPWLQDSPFGGDPYDPAVNILAGNSSLKPEKATTTTLGFVLSPGGRAQGMHFSVDWYRIRLVNGISGGFSTKTITSCYQGDAFYCSQIEGTPGEASGPNMTVPGPDGSYGFADITQVRAPYENGRPYRAEGLDMVWDHNLELNTWFASAPGSIAVRASVTRALKTEVDYLIFPEYQTRDVAGQVGAATFLADYAPAPKWLGNFTVSYLNGPVTLTLQSQWTGAGTINAEQPWIDPADAGYSPALANTIDDNTIGNYFNFNLNGSYNLKLGNLKSAQVFTTVNNLFDRDPPFSNGAVGGVNGTFYDTLGRTFRLGLRARF